MPVTGVATRKSGLEPQPQFVNNHELPHSLIVTPCHAIHLVGSGWFVAADYSLVLGAPEAPSYWTGMDTVIEPYWLCTALHASMQQNKEQEVCPRTGPPRLDSTQIASTTPWQDMTGLIPGVHVFGHTMTYPNRSWLVVSMSLPESAPKPPQSNRT